MRSEDSFIQELTTSSTDLMVFRATVLRMAAKVMDRMYGPIYVTDPLSGVQVNLAQWLATVYPTEYTPYEVPVPRALTREDVVELAQVFNDMGRAIVQGQALPSRRGPSASLAVMDEAGPHYTPQDAETTVRMLAQMPMLTQMPPQKPPKAPVEPAEPQKLPEPHRCPECGQVTEYRAFTGGREWDCLHCKADGTYPEGFGVRATLLGSEEGRKSLREQMRGRLHGRRGSKE